MSGSSPTGSNVSRRWQNGYAAVCRTALSFVRYTGVRFPPCALRVAEVCDGSNFDHNLRNLSDSVEYRAEFSRKIEKGRVFMIKVKSRGNETAEQMLRRFKKMCEKEGLTKDIKRVAYYEKPSEKRRRRNRKGGPRPVR